MSSQATWGVLNFRNVLFGGRHANAVSRPLTSYSADLRRDLVQKILPYWHDTSLDRTNGGYILSDDIRAKGVATEKQIVTQSRLIWTFSHVHLKGYSTAERNYLKAAEHGYRFVIENFLDKKSDGYFWTTDLHGRVLNDRKILYGQAFVIYSLVEYFRASNKHEALRHSMELYRKIQRHTYDTENGGWIEHFTRYWKPILQPYWELVGVAGYKSANAHLHLMEALSELYEATLDGQVKESLQEAVRLNVTYFYPADAGRSCLHRHPDWKRVTDPRNSMANGSCL
jgi:mannobiose 2-epimerase